MEEVLNIDLLTADMWCRIGFLPSTHLGLPLGDPYKKIDMWNPGLENLQKWLTGWKSS